MGADRLLRLLGDGAWRSGEEIAGELGVTRAAVWKAVERLRRQGYAIDAAAGRGYRLAGTTDRLLPGEIRPAVEPRRLRGPVVHRDVVDSTNRLAIDLARDGAEEGTAVVAEEQTAGRGRLGRTWESPPRLNLYLSVVLRPPMPPVDVPLLALVAAVAVAEAIAAETGLRAEIKWPNDVLLGGRKAAGILTELEAEADRVRFVVLGIGVNLNAGRDDLPPELRDKATSLARECGRPVDRAGFTARLLERLDADYDELLAAGFTGLRRRYEERHALTGRWVAVEGARRIEGEVRGIDADGALLVETTAGVERVLSGEVTLAGAYRGG